MVVFNIRQPNAKSQASVKPHMNSASQPQLRSHMNLLTFQGVLMVPKCLLHKSQPQGIFPLATLCKAERLFLGTLCVFWEKMPSSLISKHVMNRQLKPWLWCLLLCVSVDLGGLPWESQYYLRQEKNEGMNLVRGSDNCRGANEKFHF